MSTASSSNPAAEYESLQDKHREMQLLSSYRHQILANASALFGGICDVCTIRTSASDDQPAFSAAVFRPSTEKGSVKVFLMRNEDEEERIREMRGCEREDEDEETKVVFKHAFLGGDEEDDEGKENRKNEDEEDEDMDMENEGNEEADEADEDEDVTTPLTSRLAAMEKLLDLTESAIQEARFVALTAEDWELLEKGARKREPTPCRFSSAHL
ncbi:hypothetical protein W97_06051 [Coniosporium apollinis CBS 100218]|uniref:Uncharacterized protein n=1 Tax=Coniosporium apollinis (strain CBS 100218) TaxID=1168221 RepID=R7YZ33_CONA1|nr:uncharacterized protein W97_06051 [Coniosporium apollinis CBS 100218]EON66936.1 hypothetical protein W97_06051 [Coniosporium apollinis CBS 100218]